MNELRDEQLEGGKDWGEEDRTACESHPGLQDARSC